MKILHVVPSLAPGGSARQVRLLGPQLARAGCRVEVCCLGADSPWAHDLRRAGIAVHVLNWTRAFDPGAVLRLRGLLRMTRPDLVHVWRGTALRAVALAERTLLPRVVVSGALPTRGAPAWWDRWLLRRVGCFAASGPGEHSRCERAGLPSARLAVVPLAVAWEGERVAPAVPTNVRSIACVGALRRENGFRDAIWAIDILAHVFPGIRLYLAGAGPQRLALQEFARGLRCEGRTHFLGTVDDIAGLLQSAEVCWVPSRADVGRQAALEAMAQGRPIVAADVPSLRELIRDGETGLLYPPGDLVALARGTRALLLDADLRDRLGAAARATARRHHAAAEVAHGWRDLYERVAA